MKKNTKKNITKKLSGAEAVKRAHNDGWLEGAIDALEHVGNEGEQIVEVLESLGAVGDWVIAELKRRGHETGDAS